MGVDEELCTAPCHDTSTAEECGTRKNEGTKRSKSRGGLWTNDGKEDDVKEKREEKRDGQRLEERREEREEDAIRRALIERR